MKRNMSDVRVTLKIYVHTYRIYEGQGRTDESPSFEKYTYGSYVDTVTIFDESVFVAKKQKMLAFQNKHIYLLARVLR